MQLAVSPLLSQQLPLAEASSAVQVGQHSPNLASKPDAFASSQGLAPQTTGGKQAFGFFGIGETLCALCCGVPLAIFVGIPTLILGLVLSPKIARGIASLFGSGQVQHTAQQALQRVERAAPHVAPEITRA
jgi:hypothetical protein